jgi:hypothetical protein
MTGAIINMNWQAIDAARREWSYSFEKPIQNLDVHKFQYFVARIGNQIKFLAKVSNTSVFPGKNEASWRVNFSEIYEVESLDIPLGDSSDLIVLISPSSEKKLEESILDAPALRRPEELPLCLTIAEAEEALHLRYGISKSNIKISLHN